MWRMAQRHRKQLKTLRRAYIPKRGERFRVVYLEGAERKEKDFAELQDALDFYSKQGADRASVLTLTISGNPKAKLDLSGPQ